MRIQNNWIVLSVAGLLPLAACVKKTGTETQRAIEKNDSRPKVTELVS